MCRNQFFLYLQSIQDLNKIKNLEHPFAGVVKKVTCVKFQQKVLKSIVVPACESFQFFRQKTWFLENNRALPKFL